ncbi:MAG TPA: hypothetical protein VFM10_01710 [Terriglobales bacterium]|nr:hypothetical protein [Terriglobales bacterium]
MNCSRLLVLILCCTFFTCGLFAESPLPVQPNAGAVAGSRYTSTFFNFNYYIPENWAVRTVAAKAPGTGLPLLLSLKKKSGNDAISAILITATELPTIYNGDLSRYLADRYVPAQAASQTTINGIPTSKITRSSGPAHEPELLSIGNRNYYRLKLESPGISRVAVATLEKNYALVFELITPSKDLDPMEMELIDSLHGLNFAAAGQSGAGAAQQ